MGRRRIPHIALPGRPTYNPPRRLAADGRFANPVRSGRKQP
jgi:hypothetical protein